MVGWHPWLDRHEFEQALGVGDGQGGLACCSSWGCRVRHDWVTELNWNYFTILWCFLPYIHIGCTCVPHSDPSSHLPPHPISQGHTSAPALSTVSHVLNLDRWYISHMIIYMFQCYALRSSQPRLLPLSPKDCSVHLCLFCCLAYRVIVNIFLNSIYMC